jgi:Icc-related predicted phosphoesterase
MRSMMNDYRHIRFFDEIKSVYHRLNPENTIQLHKDSLNYIKLALQANCDTEQLPVVMVTHHSPSKQSIHPRYQHDVIMNAAYSSELSEFILDHPEIQVWTHGHTHDPFDYMIGSTRIICNPRGYKNYEQRAENFDPTFGFEV